MKCTSDGFERNLSFLAQGNFHHNYPFFSALLLLNAVKGDTKLFNHCLYFFQTSPSYYKEFSYEPSFMPWGRRLICGLNMFFFPFLKQKYMIQLYYWEFAI